VNSDNTDSARKAITTNSELQIDNTPPSSMVISGVNVSESGGLSVRSRERPRQLRQPHQREQ
jgi:hypothetical protein